jgi:hypothetical protein
LTANPILKVLFTFRRFGVKSLLIGGQACIIYGAAEFSRDSDFFILCDTSNLHRLKKALAALKARRIYYPPLKKEYLERGHACHFRCGTALVKNLRIDVLARMRNCDPFEKLWPRRHTIRILGKTIDVIGLEDLVRSKKTQRDKDWLMLNRLVNNDIMMSLKPSPGKIAWWLYECRDVGQLIRLTANYKKFVRVAALKRPLLKVAIKKDKNQLEKLLHREELMEREKDRQYWGPLIRELETLRYKRSLKKS